MTARPFRSTTRVVGDTYRRISSDVPTPTNRPSFTATACAMVNALSTVMILPLTYTVSAIGGASDAHALINASATQNGERLQRPRRAAIFDLLHEVSVCMAHVEPTMSTTTPYPIAGIVRGWVSAFLPGRLAGCMHRSSYDPLRPALADTQAPLHYLRSIRLSDRRRDRKPIATDGLDGCWRASRPAVASTSASRRPDPMPAGTGSTGTPTQRRPPTLPESTASAATRRCPGEASPNRPAHAAQPAEATAFWTEGSMRTRRAT